MNRILEIIMAIVTAFSLNTASEANYETLEDYKKNAKIIFEDNFDGDYLDETKWKKCPEGDRHGPLDTWDDDMVSLDGKGKLLLHAQWNEEEGKIHSGAIQTQELFEETYGYYEASVKFKYTPGVWSAFWIMAGDVMSEENSSEDGVEIDIIETSGENKEHYHSVLHWDGYDENKKTLANTYSKINIYDGKFHTFGVWRRKDAYIFYVDDIETWRVTDSDIPICDLPGYMLLSVEGA